MTSESGIDSPEVLIEIAFAIRRLAGSERKSLLVLAFHERDLLGAPADRPSETIPAGLAVS